jgi:radical SAM protein with 4Fe4S-binding SPASM domain
MAGKFVKPVNAVLSGTSFLLSSLRGTPVIAGMPAAISFELTNHCNLNCPECASGSGEMKRERGFLDIELYKRVISELKPYLFYINLYFQGEPMLHPRFFSFTEHTGKIYTMVSTNGHYLTPENSARLIRSGIGKLIVSLDGMDQEIYSLYRVNGDFEKVKSGIKNITEARRNSGSSMNLEIQFLVNKFNEHQIPLVKNFAREAGASLKLKSMQVISEENRERWTPSTQKYRRYENVEGRQVIKNRMPNRCFRLWFNPVITWDGKVFPCCFDKDAEYIMGDLNNESFRSVWNGARYFEFRKQLLSGRSNINICTNCTSGMRRVRY